jgi:hypothetical protein
VAAIVAGALAGCGSSSNHSGTVSASSYIGQLCTSTAGWLKGIEHHNATLENELAGVSPAQGKHALEMLITNSVSDTENVVTALRVAGVPDVNNGKKISQTVVSSFEGISNRLASLQAQVAAIPTNNTAAYVAATKKIRETVREAPLRLGLGVASVNSPELEKAASESAVCKSVGARSKA